MSAGLKYSSQGWSSPSEQAAEADPRQAKSKALQELKLGANEAMILRRVRVAYIMNLLGDLISETAQNISEEQWKVLEKDHIQEILAHIDCCLMCGHETLCAVWTACMADLMTTHNIEPTQVLASCKVKPVTPQAKIYMRDTAGLHGGNNDGTEEPDADPVSFFTIQEMFNFGASEAGAAADVLASLRAAIERHLLDEARKLEHLVRQKLMVMVTLSEDAKNRAQTNHELLMPVTAKDVLTTPSGSDKLVCHMPADFKLMFFGSVRGLLACPV